MEKYNIYHARRQFSALVARAEKGEEIIIAKNGRPVAVLSKYTPQVKKRRGGQWKGKVWIAPDFDDFSHEPGEIPGIDED